MASSTSKKRVNLPLNDKVKLIKWAEQSWNYPSISFVSISQVSRLLKAKEDILKHLKLASLVEGVI